MKKERQSQGLPKKEVGKTAMQELSKKTSTAKWDLKTAVIAIIIIRLL
jgi:hypothetical protein